jgi:ATP-dependent Clp protease protease subunit
VLRCFYGANRHRRSAGNYRQSFPVYRPRRPPGFCIHLLIHSLGGQIPDGVPDGVILHNFFKAFPHKLILYNGGNVDSAAVLAFLGARERRASAYATFTIHRSIFTFDGPQNAAALQELADKALVEDRRTEAILRAGITLTDAEWAAFTDYKDVRFSAEDALRVGLIQQIADFSPPPRTTLFGLVESD